MNVFVSMGAVAVLFIIFGLFVAKRDPAPPGDASFSPSASVPSSSPASPSRGGVARRSRGVRSR